MIEPAPEVIMDANGHYWRRYSSYLSMTPTTPDNKPLPGPFTVYAPVRVIAALTEETDPVGYGGTRPRGASTRRDAMKPVQSWLPRQFVDALVSCEAARAKYRQLGREIEADAARSDLLHTHSKLGIFLSEVLGEEWTEWIVGDDREPVPGDET